MKRGGEHLGRKWVCVKSLHIYPASSEWARGKRALNDPYRGNNTEKSGFGVGLKAPIGKIPGVQDIFLYILESKNHLSTLSGPGTAALKVGTISLYLFSNT